MTEIESRPRNRALVASFLFTDLVGYSKGTASDQFAAKATLSEILSKNLAPLNKDDYRVKDTGDGALIAFLSNPEHALYMALAIAEDFDRAARDAGFPSNSLRTGLHIGAVKEAIDLEARPNFVGDGINAAKRIMDFAAPGEITASRAYFEAVSWLDSAYAALFRHLGASDDKHGRAHELYAVTPNAAVLEKLRQDVAPTSRARAAEPEAKVEPSAIGSQPGTSERVDDSPAAERRAVGGARRWLVPVGGLIAVAAVLAIFARMVWTDPAFVTARPAASEAASPRREAAVPTAGPPAETLRTANPALSPAETLRAPNPAPPPAAPSRPEVATTSRISPDAIPPAAPPVSRPSSVVPAVPTNLGAERRKATELPPALQAAPMQSGQGSARCQRIMEKATLGETLSQDEKRELANSCR